MNLEQVLDRLYAAPLESFTATRNALATELTGSDAATVRGLKKPNLAAWATNQLARRHAAEVRQLFEVTDKLRHAHRRVLSGGKATDLRTATDERHKVIGRLTKLAESILTEAGHAASASTLQTIGETLTAIASDEEGAELLRAGRLSRPLEPSALVDVTGLHLVESADATEVDEQAAEADPSALLDARRAVSEARGGVKDARNVAKEADRHAEKLARAAEEAERRARAAAEEAEFARRAAEGRAAELEEAERRLSEASARLTELERG